jgi:hypothetical protein
MPGGGLSTDGDRWLASRADFLVPAKALSIIFRGKFRDILRREGMLKLVNPAVGRRDWVVHSEATGDGRHSLRYLAPYVVRVAIGDHRIVSCDDGKVTFTYRRVGSNRPRKWIASRPPRSMMSGGDGICALLECRGWSRGARPSRRLPAGTADSTRRWTYGNGLYPTGRAGLYVLSSVADAAEVM